MAADVVISEPNKKGDQRNYHAHILTSTRRLRRDGFGEKTRQLDVRTTQEIEKIREKWEQMCNYELLRNGQQTISSKSLKAQSLDQLPTIHIGVAATAIARRGEESYRYNLNQEIKGLPKLKAQLAELEKKIARVTAVKN